MGMAPVDVKTFMPGAGASVSVTSSSSTATDAGASTMAIAISCTVPFHMRAGAADVGAATTSDVRFPADVVHVFDVSSGVRYFRVIRSGSSDGTLTWGVVK